jgi:hypothetical protein
MKRSWAFKWVKALESGRYKQTVGALRKMKGKKPAYCCLGVLCNIATKGKKWKQNGKLFAIFDEVGTVPPDLQEMLCMSSDNPEIPYGDDYKGMTGLNDDENLSFKEIAALIRKNWRSL